MITLCRINRYFSVTKAKTYNKTKYFQANYERLIIWSKNYSNLNFELVTKKVAENCLKTMKLETPQFRSCITPEVELLNNLFSSNGFEIRIVGGAVRDLFLGKKPDDLDFSTDATPEEMKKIFTENNIRMLNRNGEKHGTITTRINEKNFEITTLRVDIATNGRHAEVEFTKNWFLDANRRDLTINAMYLRLDGTVYDYFNGREDLKNRRIVFVGDAAERIKEDYLRILRYFRFYGRIAELPDNHDEDVLSAIKNNANGLEKVAGERILVELNKILTGKFCGEMLLKMISLGIGPYIGFPEVCNELEVKKLCDRLKLKDITVKPFTFLASVFHTEEEFVDKFVSRIKPSRFEQSLATFIINNREIEINSDPKKFYLLFSLKQKMLPDHLFRSVFLELLKYQGKIDYLNELEKWEIPKFPVNGNHLLEKGVPKKNCGTVLNALKEIWIQHNLNISKLELLEHIPAVLLQTEEVFPCKKKKKQV